MAILDTIAQHARERVKQDMEHVSLDEAASSARALAQEELARDQAFRYPFETALQKPGLSFICEVKKASPSKGVIAEDFPYLEIAQEYEQAGADAISCLTEPRWFLGRDEYLSEITQAVSIPVLRKDFVVDEYMIYQAKVLGAHAVLLICALLDDDQLARFGALAHELGMSALVEAHDADEIARAVDAKASIIGVNNRNLKDFTVDFTNARNLRGYIPDDVLYVVESGVSSTDDVAAIAQIGADAVLVGEALMRAQDKGATLQAFRDAAQKACSEPVSPDSAHAFADVSVRASSHAFTGAPECDYAGVTDRVPAVKICGLSQPSDVATLNNLLPDFVGFVFYPQSKRHVSPDEAHVLREALDNNIITVGVFVDASVEEIAAIFEAGTITVAQLHGSEDEAFLQELRARCPELAIWKAFEVATQEDFARAQACSADLVLFDAGKGSGTSFSWTQLPYVDRPYALAGGLDPENVTDALLCCSVGAMPLVVDVSSGVEAAERAADGRTKKDPRKLAAFIQAVRDFTD